MATRALLAIAMAAAALGTALGASYTVGAPRGSWDTQTNYVQWTSSIKFLAGDQVLFRYSRAAHNVVEVSKADYDACSASSPIASFQTGNDIVPLTAAGSRYFICGVPGHCDVGMKVRIDVEEATPSGSTGAPVSPRGAAPSMAPMPSATTPSTSGQAMPPSSSAMSARVGSVGLCLGAVFTAGPHGFLLEEAMSDVSFFLFTM
jgi:plastocyanin